MSHSTSVFSSLGVRFFNFLRCRCDIFSLYVSTLRKLFLKNQRIKIIVVSWITILYNDWLLTSQSYNNHLNGKNQLIMFTFVEDEITSSVQTKQLNTNIALNWSLWVSCCWQSLQRTVIQAGQQSTAVEGSTSFWFLSESCQCYRDYKVEIINYNS